MKLSDIYFTLIEYISDTTGKSYVLNRAPQINFSDGFSGVYRYVRPSRIQKERRSQGAPETIVEVEVGLLALRPNETTISDAEDELDTLLNTLLRTGQIAPNIIVYAASCAPSQSTYTNDEGLGAEVPILIAQATIAVRGYY